VKIVFDTNVLLAGIFTHGVCEALLDVCLGSEEHEVFISDYILEEFSRHAEGKFKVPPDRVQRAIKVLREQMKLVIPAPVPADACRDGDDLEILGTLLSADADWLVTGDKDLLVLKRFESRRILTPRQCFDLLTR
jgi:uncharacterized protein